MLTSRFLWQLWLTLAGTVAVSTLVFGFVTARQLEVDTRAAIRDNLQVQSTILQRYLAPLLRAGKVVDRQVLQDLTNGFENRVTVIDPTGRVLADSHQDALAMDNHLSRPEIMQAQIQAFGVSERYSDTLQQTMLYVTAQVTLKGDGINIGFVRVAMPLSIIHRQLSALRSQIFVTATLITLASLLIGFFLEKRITQPISDMTVTAEQMTRGHYDLRISADRKDEIGKLSNALNELASGTQGRIRDLTQGRNELATILAGLNEGVIAVDLNECIVHINDPARNMLNLRADDLQSNFRGIVHSNEINRAVEACLQEQIPVTLSVSSQDLDLDVSVSPLGGLEDDVPVGVIVVLQDVTEFLHLEKVRSDFVANASHELKTPISAIRGLSETIIDDPSMDKEFMDRFLNRIRSQAMRLDNIVQDLIHLSRFDSSDRDIESAMVDLTALTRRVFDTKIEDASDLGVALSLDIIDQGMVVAGEAEALDQMLVNLVDNAIKYSERDTGRVVLRLSRVGSMALIEVEDNGMGIPKAEQQRVFERFYRVDSGRSRDQGGTGLGLSIVKHIARTHHGEVTLTSDMGKGCLFAVRLPLTA